MLVMVLQGVAAFGHIAPPVVVYAKQPCQQRGARCVPSPINRGKVTAPLLSPPLASIYVIYGRRVVARNLSALLRRDDGILPQDNALLPI